ncbi:hypothetical protein IHE44_0013230, partial [Lamprotornis superbus]
RRRKRPGGAADSRPARKRSRLQPSSTAGTLKTEPIDLEESGTPALEPAGGQDLTSESSVPEIVVVLSDDEAPVFEGERGKETAQAQICLGAEIGEQEVVFRWFLSASISTPFQDREQSQQQSHLSRASENSAEPQARDDEEEPRKDNAAWPAGPASPLVREDEDSKVQDREQSQQYPLGSRDTENSAQLWASDNEEEPRDNDRWMSLIMEQEPMKHLWLTQPLQNREQQRGELHVQMHSRELLVVQFAWIFTQSLICLVPMQQQTPVLSSQHVFWFSFFQIVQSGRLIVATLCGHVFCSECLPAALETLGALISNLVAFSLYKKYTLKDKHKLKKT